MKAVLFALAAATVLSSAALADQVVGRRAHLGTPVIAMGAMPPGVNPDDWRDYQLDQLDHRRDAAQRALDFHFDTMRHRIEGDH